MANRKSRIQNPEGVEPETWKPGIGRRMLDRLSASRLRVSHRPIKVFRTAPPTESRRHRGSIYSHAKARSRLFNSGCSGLDSRDVAR
jgi:hypothetical protein